MSATTATESTAMSKGEWGAEMVPYTLKPQSETWKGREISILLPKGTQYSRGVITTTQNGMTIKRQDFVDDTSIPVPSSGRVALKMGFEKSEKSENGIRAQKSNSVFTLSLSQLKGSKEQYIDQLKKSQVEVLSEKENSLVTLKKVKDAMQREVLDKTFIVNDVVLQVVKSGNLAFPLSKFYGSTETLVKLLDKIQVAPKVAAGKV